VDVSEARNRLQHELDFMRRLGGPEWSQTYVQPFYRKMQAMGESAADDAAALLPALRDRASELRTEDIAAMLSMQWRIQNVGVWYAIACCDTGLSEPIHRGFDHCYGSLTAPSLTVAALVYPNARTMEVLTQYQQLDLANKYGAAGIVAAALRQLRDDTVLESRSRDDDWLDELLSRARQLQALA
jgi:hypothetical protein